MQRVLPVILILLVSIGCTVGRGSTTFPPEADMQAVPPLGADDDGRDYRVLVANGLSETITLVERTNGNWNVTPDVLATGSSPAQLVVHEDFAYLVNSLSNSIQVIDVVNMATVREISTGAGTNPMSIAFVDDYTAMVSCYLTDEVVLLDISTETPTDERILGRIPMPSPEELPHDPDAATRAAPGELVVVDDRCFVVCSNLIFLHAAGGPGVLVEIDVPSHQISTTHVLNGRNTTGIIHSPRFPRRLVLISAGDFSLSEGFLGNGVVESFDLDAGEVFQVVNVEGAPFDGVIGSDDILFLENGKEAEVLRVDLHEATSLDGYPLPDHGLSLSYASSMLALPGLLLVTDFNSDRLYLQDPSTGEMLAELATGDGPDAMALVE